MDIQDRVALVTGGKRIGAVVAAELAARGAHVALAFKRSRNEADETATAVRARGRRAVTIEADLSRPEDCHALVERAASELGRLDVLVNMASVYASKPFDALTAGDLDDSLAIDLRAGFACALASVPHMRRAGGGRIINVADWLAASRRPRYKGYLTYYVAKSAVIALTEALALELAADGILVNAVAPGPILAPGDLTTEESESVEKATPLGRWGGSAEVAKVILGLIESDFVTGETVRVDGGRHLR